MSYVKIHANRLTELCHVNLEAIAKSRKERDDIRQKAIDKHVEEVLASKWAMFWEGKTREEIIRNGLRPGDWFSAPWYRVLPSPGKEFYRKSEDITQKILKAIKVRDDDILSISIEDLDFLV
jgi:hypothetical protein